MNTQKKSKFYVISWILWNVKDISPNMIETILDTKVLFVEFIEEVDRYFKMLNINYNWKLIELDYNFDDFSEENKKNILWTLLSGENIWIFEIWWTACFQDPWYRVIDFLYKLIDKKNIDFNIIPVPGTSAMTTAISISGFNMDKFVFWSFLDDNSKDDIISSKLPIIYFSELQDSTKKTIELLSFMNNIDDKEVFIWFNLAKNFWDKYRDKENIILRWSYKEVYNKLIDFYKNIEENKNLFHWWYEFVIIFDI